MPPDSLERVLSRVVRRIWLGHLLAALAAALVTAVVFSSTALVVRVPAAFAAAAAVLVYTARYRTRREAARRVELALPGARNVIVTAQELAEHPERASAAAWARVKRDAERAAVPLVYSRATSLRLPLVLCGLALLLFGAMVYVRSWPAPAATAVREAVAAVQRVTVGHPTLSISVVPPRYTGLKPWTAEDPTEIRAIEGSVATLRLRDGTGGVRLRFGARELPMRTVEGHVETVVRLADSGYIAVETQQQRRLVPIVVTPDAAPNVKIDRPARDLLIPSADRRLAIAASATDDLALGMLEVRYTKVSGSGEDFEFVEGTLPARVVREGDRRWTATADMSLKDLGLEPGDALVYRAVAQDRRDGRGLEASSDTFFVELAGPGQVALEGFDLPPEQERYALSQQMVVVKIERLRARERSLPRGALEEATAEIAAEQRAVRAYFVFLMGGHVEDEEVEAEQSHEIQEGRLENTARREISNAIHLMTRAEQDLVAVQAGMALRPAKQAVEALQRAFGRNRYILRTPPARTEVDLARRLTGSLAGTRSWSRRPVERPPEARAARVQAFARDVLDFAARLRSEPRFDVNILHSLAEQALAIDPTADEWRRASQELRSGARVAENAAAGQARSDAVRLALTRALAPAVKVLEAHSTPVPGEPLRRPSPTSEAWHREGKR